ncbi:MAG: transposase [Deltaproteobacteria bacterium]|nr:transposase [Deltaproteobacteria bacterium]
MENLITLLRKAASSLIDPRKGKNIQYSCLDLVLSAFACFWAQDPSFLQFQRRMKIESQKSNMTTLFGAFNIPTDDQIRNFIDLIDYRELNQTFYDVISYLESQNQLNEFRVLNDKYYVLALDGSQYFSSYKVHCPNCLIKEHSNGQTEYIHNLLQASLVSPKINYALPLAPEFNEKDDTNSKQDCERKAITRWFDHNYVQLMEVIGDKEIIVLADDLHSRQPFVTLLEEKNINYILNCKENSHKTIKEFVNTDLVNNFSCCKHVNGFVGLKKHTYRWLNGLPLRNSLDACRVNWFSLTIEGTRKRKIELPSLTDDKKSKKQYTYINDDITFSWITNLPIDETNIVEYAQIGRSRWKIENSNFNVLKNHGYNLEHNFGHGHNNLSNALATLNILAFSFHNAVFIADKYWIKALQIYNSRATFLNALKEELSKYLYKSFNDLILNFHGSRAPPII